MISLAENIKRMRIWRGVSQESLAECLNITPQAVSRWESGSSYPDVEFLPALAAIFGVSMDSLFGLDVADEEEINLDEWLSALGRALYRI